MRQDLAFLFPGQGSQRVGMLAEAVAAFPEVAVVFEESSDALGFDLAELILSGDPDQLNLTEFTQPALLAGSVALWRVWLSLGGAKPAAMAGHSLGEFSALCCAGALELRDAVTLVRERGRFMQTAVPVGQGAMVAVLGLDDESVMHICDQVSAAGHGLVQAVNFNAPGQVVIAGDRSAVDAAVDAMNMAGAKRSLPLPVSAPFHTSLMIPAGEKLEQTLRSVPLSAPEIPVVHNVHAQTEIHPERIRELLVQQISAPVRWTACIRTLTKSGVAQFAECGAGKVLGGLLRRIDRNMPCAYLESPDDLREAVGALASG